MMGLWLVMQFIISAHAGLVNYVDGPTNIRVHDQAAAGVPVKTSAGDPGRNSVESPDRFSGMDQENTKVVLDLNVDTTNIRGSLCPLAGNAIVVVKLPISTSTLQSRLPRENCTRRSLLPTLISFFRRHGWVLMRQLQVAGSSRAVKKGKEGYRYRQRLPGNLLGFQRLLRCAGSMERTAVRGAGKGEHARILPANHRQLFSVRLVRFLIRLHRRRQRLDLQSIS